MAAKNDQPEPEVIIARKASAGRITLNRPDALNALTYPMIGMIHSALRQWGEDPEVELVILDGAGSRGLCAGGDVRALYDSRADGLAFGNKFWRDEYHLNHDISRFAKPFVAIMDGIVMGGGIGLSAHGSHRIVTENSKIAMPETGIGLVPDVGGSWLLGHAQGELGTYLGLTGAQMSGSDAIQTGFADVFVPAQQLPALTAKLEQGGAGLVDEIIADFETTIPKSKLAEARRELDDWFAFDSVEEILARLNTTTNELAQNARKAMLRKSPKSSKLALAALRATRKMSDLAPALQIEYRMVTRLFADGEFIEGVRALIIDKDRRPKWSPAHLQDVTPDLVAEYLSALPPAEELVLQD